MRARGHADDRMGLAVERHHPSDHMGIAVEEPVPRAVAQNRDAIAPIGETEPPSERGRPSQEREELRRDRQHADGFGTAAVIEHAARRGKDAGVARQPGLPVPVGQIGARDIVEPRARTFHLDGRQPVWIGEGQRPPQLRVGDAEDADRHDAAEGQRQQGGRGEGRLAPQHPRAIHGIAPETLHRGAQPHVARVFARERDVPHRPAAGRGGFRGRQAAGLERGLRLGAMVLHFGRQVVGVAAGPDPERGATEQLRHGMTSSPIVRRWEASRG
jgi:hypothetical protein